MNGDEIMQAGRNPGATTKTESHCIDFFLHPPRSFFQQVSNLGQAGMEHKGTRLRHFAKRAGNAQEQLRIHFHGTADIDQYEQVRRALARALPHRCDRLAAEADAFPERTAQVDGMGIVTHLFAAQQTFAHFGSHFFGQPVQLLQIGLQPFAEILFGQGIDGAGAACRMIILLALFAFRCRRIDLEDIVWLEASNYYIWIATVEGRYLSNLSLADLEARIEPEVFFRCHRSHIVNLKFVKEIDRVGDSHQLLLEKIESAKVPVSRKRIAVLKSLLGLP